MNEKLHFDLPKANWLDALKVSKALWRAYVGDLYNRCSTLR